MKRAYGLVEARALVALTAEQEILWCQIEGAARARYAVGEASQRCASRSARAVQTSQAAEIETGDVNDAEALAKEATAFAEYHRMRGKEMEGK